MIFEFCLCGAFECLPWDTEFVVDDGRRQRFRVIGGVRRNKSPVAGVGAARKVTAIPSCGRYGERGYCALFPEKMNSMGACAIGVKEYSF